MAKIIVILLSRTLILDALPWTGQRCARWVGNRGCSAKTPENHTQQEQQSATEAESQWGDSALQLSFCCWRVCVLSTLFVDNQQPPTRRSTAHAPTRPASGWPVRVVAKGGRGDKRDAAAPRACWRRIDLPIAVSYESHSTLVRSFPSRMKDGRSCGRRLRMPCVTTSRATTRTWAATDRYYYHASDGNRIIETQMNRSE